LQHGALPCSMVPWLHSASAHPLSIADHQPHTLCPSQQHTPWPTQITNHTPSAPHNSTPPAPHRSPTAHLLPLATAPSVPTAHPLPLTTAQPLCPSQITKRVVTARALITPMQPAAVACTKKYQESTTWSLVNHKGVLGCVDTPFWSREWAAAATAQHECISQLDMQLSRLECRTFSAHLALECRMFSAHLALECRTFSAHLALECRTFSAHLALECRTFSAHLALECRTFSAHLVPCPAPPETAAVFPAYAAAQAVAACSSSAAALGATKHTKDKLLQPGCVGEACICAWS